ncbi:MAG: hypothetical protein RSD41_03660 [Kiritimatiellia bacterium]
MKSLLCLILMSFVLLSFGCSFLEEKTRRKIQIYDFNQRKVIAVLNNFSPDRWREFPERYPDFKNKTFATCQRMSAQRTILRKYTFRGEFIRQWDIPEDITRFDNFSVRGEQLVYTEDFYDDKGAFKVRLMVRQLSDLNIPGIPISPNPTSQSLAAASFYIPPFIFLTDDTLLCLMEPDDDSGPLQLWKVLLTGEKTQLPYSVQGCINDLLSSDISGIYHAIQISQTEVLFMDNDANVITRLSVNFPIRDTWWDDNHYYWAHDYLSGSYLCYDVERQSTKEHGKASAWNLNESAWRVFRTFGRGQYTIVRKELMMGFLRVKIQNKKGDIIGTLPWLSSRVIYLGDGIFIIEEQ